MFPPLFTQGLRQPECDHRHPRHHRTLSIICWYHSFALARHEVTELRWSSLLVLREKYFPNVFHQTISNNSSRSISSAIINEMIDDWYIKTNRLRLIWQPTCYALPGHRNRRKFIWLACTTGRVAELVVALREQQGKRGPFLKLLILTTGVSL